MFLANVTNHTSIFLNFVSIFVSSVTQLCAKKKAPSKVSYGPTDHIYWKKVCGGRGRAPALRSYMLRKEVFSKEKRERKHFQNKKGGEELV